MSACRRTSYAAVPDPAPAAAGAQGGRRGCARAADRRTRPYRRAVRGVPAGSAVGFPDHHPGTRRDPAPQSRRWSSITSNRTREIHDAIKRRCFYHWVDYPGRGARTRDPAPQVPAGAASRWPRNRRLHAAPARHGSVQGAGHGRDARLGRSADRARSRGARPAGVDDTLGVLLKYQDDVGALAPDVAAKLVAEVQAEGIRF